MVEIELRVSERARAAGLKVSSRAAMVSDQY